MRNVPPSREIAGWLKNKERKLRRESPMTLTDEQVMNLIQKIDSAENYTKLGRESDRLIRMRDKSLIAQSWIFFKRANENLRTRLRDVYYDERELMITFRISKKKKRYKVCTVCGDKNALKANFCKKCGGSLETVEPSEKGKALVVTKRKSMEYPFCKYVVEWVGELRRMGVPLDAYIYPPYKTVVGGFVFSQHITVDRFNQILQRLDYTLSSHMFRYGASEKYLMLGYTTYDLKEIGDWASIKMPELYAERKGLTKSQKRFADDTRMI